jgi:hypothetical protein
MLNLIKFFQGQKGQNTRGISQRLGDWRMTWRYVPDLCARDKKAKTLHPLDNASLGQCVPWTMHPLDNASLGQCVPWTMHPVDNASLGQCVPWMMWSIDVMCPDHEPHQGTNRGKSFWVILEPVLKIIWWKIPVVPTESTFLRVDSKSQLFRETVTTKKRMVDPTLLHN